ncbi:MAG: hypothetical protein CL693_02935 [Cellvibrionaceae bacterium]|nr:hypothetical protein [Cellvibrionaceae bacterium]|tara:strand:- start:214 stop:1098 length:885 start_codon:yes stop_codon:yes gene_type:complete
MKPKYPQSPLPVEIVSGGDPLRDYCLWDYPPREPPEGKWHASNLLFQSFKAAGLDDTFIPVCQAIREAIGFNQTVWGIKLADGRISWEFYFYDYERLERQVSISKLIDALKPFVSCELQYSESRPYFMFSLDLDASWGQPRSLLKEINIYMGNVGSNVSSGLSYSLTKKGLLFENLYSFFDAQQERDQAIEKALCSTHFDLPQFPLDTLFLPQLIDCGVLVVANKRECDGIYFSRISVDQLLWFMEEMAYPEALTGYIRDNRDMLAHLSFDVGLDYLWQDGRIRFHKTAYYGVF